jgi:ABC-type uncharacterized transport system substrate-binding protein
MDRRTLIAGTLALLTAPRVAEAEQQARVPVVAYFSPTSDASRGRLFLAFKQGLRELGWVEGQNVAVESRWGENDYDRLPALAADLVRLKVDVIVTGGVPAIRAAQQATRTIPIVMALVEDPVASGLVASLGHPGGNTTGLSMMAPDLVGKQMELLKGVVPKVSRMALLWNPANPGNAWQSREAESAARALGVQLQAVEARSPEEIAGAFAAMARERAGALVVLQDATLTNQARKLAALAAEGRLPAIYARREHPDVGGLMSYGPNVPEMFRRAATFVDKILKGAKPADLPVEQPSKFELVVNLKAAKALGLTIPPSVLARADEVIHP